MTQDLLRYKPLVLKYLQRSAQELSVYSFPNIFLWQDFFEFQFEEMHDHLCVYATDEGGTFLYLPPLGPKPDLQIIKKCFWKMNTLNKGGSVSRIENVSESALALYRESGYQIFKKGQEYLYYRRELEDLAGQQRKSQRNAYNHFVKNYQVQYLPYRGSMKEECLELYDRWAEQKKQLPREEIYLHMLEDNRKVHERVLDSFETLEMVGRVIALHGKVIGYTFGYFIRDNLFCDYLEIADHAFKGLAPFMFTEFCRDPALARAQFINTMDDFALDSVGATKMSYHPVLLLPLYVVSSSARTSRVSAQQAVRQKRELDP